MHTAIILALSLSLSQAWDRAQTGNPEIRAANEHTVEMEYAIRSARSRAFPQVELVGTQSGSINPGFLNSSDFEDLIQEFPFSYVPQVNYLYDLSLTVSQDLYTGGTVKTGMQAARLARDVAVNDRFRVRNRVMHDVALAYVQLALVRKSREIYDANRRQQELFLRQVQDRMEVGDATRLDILKARVALSEVLPELYRIRSDESRYEGDLRALMGVKGTEKIETAPLPAIEVKPDMEELAAYAVENHPDVRELRYRVEEMRIREALVRAEGKPQASLTGGYGYSVADTANFGDPLYKAWNYGISIRLPLFDGFDRASRAAGFRSRRVQEQEQLRAARLSVATGVRSLTERMRFETERLEANRALYDQAQEALRIAEETYGLGAVTQLEVLDAQRQERFAHLEWIRSQHDLFMARIDLLYEAGVPLYQSERGAQ